MTKKKVKVPTPLGDRIKTCLLAIAELYPAGKIAPGVVLSWLAAKKQFYASFARYEVGNPAQKIIVAQGYGATLDEAVEELIKNWRAGTVNARQLAGGHQTGRLALTLKRGDDGRLGW